MKAVFNFMNASGDTVLVKNKQGTKTKGGRIRKGSAVVARRTLLE